MGHVTDVCSPVKFIDSGAKHWRIKGHARASSNGCEGVDEAARVADSDASASNAIHYELSKLDLSAGYVFTVYTVHTVFTFV